MDEDPLVVHGYVDIPQSFVDSVLGNVPNGDVLNFGSDVVQAGVAAAYADVNALASAYAKADADSRCDSELPTSEEATLADSEVSVAVLAGGDLSSSFSSLVDSLQDDGPSCDRASALMRALLDSQRGLPIGTRGILRRVDNCFYGSEMVDWIIHNVPSIASRAVAAELAQLLLDGRKIVQLGRLQREGRFTDARVIYRFARDGGADACNEADVDEFLGDDVKLTSDLLDDLLEEAMNPATGVDVRDRRHLLRKYPMCFIGKDMVSWLSQRLNCSRLKAVEAGQKMMNMDFFRHVLEEHNFEDSSLFYRFREGLQASAVPLKSLVLSDFSMRSIDGEMVPLSRFAGQVTLVVNVASL
jgi:hypothetical protein